jgi:nitronate monooxygenase
VNAVIRGSLARGDDGSTAITNVMTGRPARGIVNRAMRELGPVTADGPGFPHAAAAFGPLKAVAEKTGSSDFTNLWAGQAVALAGERPAEDLTRALAEDALRRLRALAV